METAAVLHNIRTIKNSDMAESLASQLSQRSSIINQGEIYNVKKQIREMTRMSTIDKRPMPSQLWYNSLRNSDNGSVGRYDQSEKSVEDVKFNYLRSKVFTPKADSIREEFAIAS